MPSFSLANPNDTMHAVICVGRHFVENARSRRFSPGKKSLACLRGDACTKNIAFAKQDQTKVESTSRCGINSAESTNLLACMQTIVIASK